MGRTVGVMEVRLFGELEALEGGVPVPVRGVKQRALLALLALRRGRPVSAGRLIDVLWGDGQAANPANALQAQIGQLRRTFGAAAILTTEAGYALAAGPGEVDVVRFEQLVATGRRLAAGGELAAASAVLGEALGLRRGEPLAEFSYAGFFDAERAHLGELILVAIESRAGADLGLGRHGELAGELEALCREHPLRERLWELLIVAQALARSEPLGAIRHARRALDLAPEDDHRSRASAAGMSGLALWGSGDLEAALSAWAECAAGLRRAGHIADIFGCAIAMADIRLAQGRLGEAMRTYEQALQGVPEQGGPVLRGTADMYVGMSEVDRERDDLDAATRRLLMSQELGEHTGLPQNQYRWRVAMARIRQAEGDLAGALELLNEAERLYTGDMFPDVRPVPALKARVWIAQGSLGEALGWAREQGLSVDDDLSYLREFEHITLARMFLARYQDERAQRSLHEAARLLERLLAAAEEGGRTGRVIEILVLQALAHHRLGGIPAALACLERAMTLAEPQGYVRVFTDEGPPMASLLQAAAKQGIARNYVRRLLAAAGGTGHDSPVKQVLIEPLSERELEVLRLLGTDLDGPAIARELVVSLNTVRTHTKNIYAKLAVTSRRAAVRRAAELGLPQTRNRQP